MKKNILNIICVIYNVAFVLVVLSGLIVFLYEMLGHSVFDKIFSLFNINWDLKKFCYVSLVFIFIWISTRLLKEKLS